MLPPESPLSCSGPAVPDASRNSRRSPWRSGSGERHVNPTPAMPLLRRELVGRIATAERDCMADWIRAIAGLPEGPARIDDDWGQAPSGELAR